MTSTYLTQEKDCIEFQFIIESEEIIPIVGDYVDFHGIRYKVLKRIFDTDKGLILLRAQSDAFCNYGH